MPEINIDRSLKYIEGTQRVLDEKSTLERTKDELGTIGVTRIASITDLDRVGIPVFSSIRPSSADGAISVYSGKGNTETQARISSMMEAFERCLAERRGTNNDVEEDIKAEHLIESYDNARYEHSVVDPYHSLLQRNTTLNH